MTNKTCDDCGVKLQGACFVDGSSLLCGDCAENLDYEREMDEGLDYEETDLFDDTNMDY